MNTLTVTVPQIAEILSAQVKSACPIAFSALVDARARKTGNPYGTISKLSKVQAFTGIDYEAGVNRQQVREGADKGTFEAQSRSWGERIGPALVRNDKTGELYLVAKVERSARPVYIVRNAAGYLQPIAKDIVAAFLPAYVKPANQGLDKDVVYRNYKLDNLVSLTLNGCRYRIRRSPFAHPTV